MKTCPHVYLPFLLLLLLDASPTINAKLEPGWRVVQESRCKNKLGMMMIKTLKLVMMLTMMMMMMMLYIQMSK